MSGGFDLIVAQLARVKRATPAHGMARAVRASCPTSFHAHGDRSAGLLVSEAQDGRVLLWCGAGCAALDVVGALGMAMQELFPEDLSERHRARSVHRPFPAIQVLQALQHEALVAWLVADAVAHGQPVRSEDTQRLALAAGRLKAGYQAAGGARHG